MRKQECSLYFLVLYISFAIAAGKIQPALSKGLKPEKRPVAQTLAAA